MHSTSSGPQQMNEGYMTYILTKHGYSNLNCIPSSFVNTYFIPVFLLSYISFQTTLQSSVMVSLCVISLGRDAIHLWASLHPLYRRNIPFLEDIDLFRTTAGLNIEKIIPFLSEGRVNTVLRHHSNWTSILMSLQNPLCLCPTP